jgi:hypothetical protein
MGERKIRMQPDGLVKMDPGLGEIPLHQAHTRSEAQQVRVSWIVKQSAAARLRRTVDLTGAQACTGLVKQVLRLNLGRNGGLLGEHLWCESSTQQLSKCQQLL